MKMNNVRSFCLVLVAILGLNLSSTNCDDRPTIYRIVLIRHGESTWNKKSICSGWYNAPLSEKGKLQAKLAGVVLADYGYKFDVAYTSLLSRAKDTLTIMLKALNQTNVTIHESWFINERHYGNLTGFNTAHVTAKYSLKQIKLWKRSYRAIPPPIESTNPHYEKILNDPAFAGHLKRSEIPRTESLKQVSDRFIPYWHAEIIPQLKAKKSIILSAHGNSLRAFVKYIENLSDELVETLEIPNGIPIIYELDSDFKAFNKIKLLK